jgi:putative tryptophan/tyrosine transport system substrate-binding protein
VSLRRAFLGNLGICLLLSPFAIKAPYAATVARIGYLSVSSASASGHLRKAFTEGLRDLGWTEGQNIVVEERWAEGNYARLVDQAVELVKLNVDVVVAAGPNPVIRAAKQATSAIPIVMIVGGDPIGQGFISSIQHPGGNITGTTWDPDPRIAEKYFEFLKEMVPRLQRVGAIVDRADSNMVYRKAAMQAASKLGLRIQEAEIGIPDEIEKAFATITGGGAQAVLVWGSTLFYLHRRQFVATAAKHRLPDIHIAREFVEAGGLMSYGVRLRDLYRGAANYVDKILKGAKPADLPIEQPTTFELVINLKTAKALGLTIPPSLLLRADQVIE